MCHELGMHRNIGKYSASMEIGETTLETYSRTWHCAVVIDIYSSYAKGLPTVIRNGEWDTPMPNWKLEAFIPYNTHVDTVSFDHQITLMAIVSNIVNIGVGVQLQNRKEMTDHVTDQLAKWFAELPLYLIKVQFVTIANKRLQLGRIGHRQTLGDCKVLSV